MTNGTSHSYYVVAFDPAGNLSAQSNVATATPTLTPLDAKVAGVYWPNWGGTPALKNIPTEYNVIYAAFAYGDGSQGGSVTWVPNDGSGESPDPFKADVQTAHSRGQKVILSVGGQNDLGIHLTTGTQVDQMVSSLNQIVTAYGFDGVDWDLETLSNVTASSLVAASNALKQRWGQNFMIAAAPAPSGL